jgi:phage terminase small subunit
MDQNPSNGETIVPEALPEKSKLTNKQRLFIEEYFRCWNATEAYQLLHPKASRRTSRINAARWLAYANIKAEIARQLSERVMSADETLKRISDIARGNLLPFIRINKDGFCFFDFSHPDAPKYFHLIKKIKTKRTRRMEGRGLDAEPWEDEWVEVELHDALTALEKMGKWHGLFVDKVDVTTKGKEMPANVIRIITHDNKNEG